MAPFITKDATLLIRDREIGALSYTFDTPPTRTEEECTNYGSAGWREYEVGLATADPSIEIYIDKASQTDPEKQLFTSLDNGAPVPVGYTLTRPAAQNDVCWFLEAFVKSLAPKRPVGKLENHGLACKNSAVMVRGRVLEVADALGTGNGAALNFGAVGSAERLYLAVWVLAFAGTSPTLDLLLQSDDAGGFPSPTTRITVPQFTSVNNGWFFGSVPGPITDTHWRIARTVGGTGSPNWTYRAAIGIAPVL